MPKFTQQELEEIRENTKRIEEERLARGAAKRGGPDAADEDSDLAEPKNTRKTQKKSKSTKKSKSRKRKKGEYSVAERLVALFLLGLTIGISYLVMLFSS